MSSFYNPKTYKARDSVGYLVRRAGNLMTTRVEAAFADHEITFAQWMVMMKLRDGLRSGKPIDVEYRVKRVDREWRWMRSRGSPRLGPSGEILRWYGSVEDIDDRKRLEEALRNNRSKRAER